MFLISVLVPVYNEEKTLLKILQKLSSVKFSERLEIIIINDGSSDNTNSIIENNKNLYSTYINLENNHGKGKAIIEGLKKAKGEYIFFQDADLEYNPDDIVKFLDKVENYGADMVMGSRFISEERSVLHFWHMKGNKFITFIFNIFNNTTFTDIYCCYCLFKSKNLRIDSLKSFGWGQQAEILTNLCLNSKKIYEVSVNYNARVYEEGKKIRYYHVFEIIFWLLYSKLKLLFK